MNKILTDEQKKAAFAEWDAEASRNNSFNETWAEHLEHNHYGMAIGHIPEVVTYVDKEFEKLKELYPKFTYTQIKLKFGKARVYLHVPFPNQAEGEAIASQIEEGIDAIVKRHETDK